MKKNVVGDLVAPKKYEKNWFKRFDLLPRLLCVLLALVVWLLVVNTEHNDQKTPASDQVEITETAS